LVTEIGTPLGAAQHRIEEWIDGIARQDPGLETPWNQQQRRWQSAGPEGYLVECLGKDFLVLPGVAPPRDDSRLLAESLEIKPGEEVLLYDDNGAHPGMQAAEMLAEAGSRLEIVSPERFFAPEIGGLNHVAYARCFQRHGVQITINTRLVAVRREGNKLAAVLGSDYHEGTAERQVDQVVVEHGTLPLDELYFALKEGSVNRGEVDYQALIAGRPQTLAGNPEGRYRLYRIGDAVSSRNIHAAVYDALRLCKDF